MQSLRPAQKLLLSLLPSFLHPKASKQDPESHTTVAKPSSSTRYTSLDGLRGVSALCVTTYHTLYVTDRFINLGSGLPYEAYISCGGLLSEQRYEAGSRFMQLPIMRILSMGPAAVAMFFLISGFVLTQRPILLARLGEWDAVLKNLSSSAFRRPFRLFLPVIAASFITMLLTFAGVMDRGSLNRDVDMDIGEEPTRVWENLPGQFWHWLGVMWRTIDVFQWNVYHPPYDSHLWTIPVELRCSLLIFLVCLALCRLRPRVRLSIIILLMLYTCLKLRWDMALFLAGMLFAETTQIKIGKQTISLDAEEPSSQKASPRSSVSFVISRLALFALLLLSLYLLSTPTACSGYAPGYSWLRHITPAINPPRYQDYSHLQLHQCIGAFIFVLLLTHWDRFNPLPPIFNTLVAQYLGRISYGLYLVHGSVLHLFGYRLFPIMWGITGRETAARFAVGWVLAWLVGQAAMIWLADLFCRGVDEPFVRLTKILERRLLADEDGAVRLS